MVPLLLQVVALHVRRTRECARTSPVIPVCALYGIDKSLIPIPRRPRDSRLWTHTRTRISYTITAATGCRPSPSAQS